MQSQSYSHEFSQSRSVHDASCGKHSALSLLLYYACYTPPMKFRVLQENLRNALLERIEEGDLTGLRLAQQTGFKQAHISNFLNRKRSLSLEGMDRVLTVQRISVLDLLDPSEINKRASIVPPSDDEFRNVVLTDGAVAATHPLLTSMNVKEILKFKKGGLKKLKTELEGDRKRWERFVAIKADAHEGMSMYPRLLPGATLLIDRHYNSLKPYRKGEFSMYAVLKNGTCTVKYVELAGNNLILRPHNQAYPIEVLAIEQGKRACDYIVGRICHVGIDT
jgi:SOS-response transcriptional repressor LexA